MSNDDSYFPSFMDNSKEKVETSTVTIGGATVTSTEVDIESSDDDDLLSTKPKSNKVCSYFFLIT